MKTDNTCALIGQLSDSERRDLESRGWTFTTVKGLKGMNPEVIYSKCLINGSLHEIMTGKVKWPKAMQGGISAIAPGPTHRTSDPWTSLRAAVDAHKGSPSAMMGTFEVMADGIDRIDQEIWDRYKFRWGKISLSAIQHARLNLLSAGLLKDSGKSRLTKDGSSSIAHVQTEVMVNEILTKGMDGCLREMEEKLGKDNRRRM